MASRDAGRTRAAVDELARAARPGHTVAAMALDLASLASVRSFAADLTGRVRSGDVPPLHAVVCNAGVQAGTTRTETADGFESTFGVNHLGHSLLVRELLPVLVAPARVVVVSSDTHDPARELGVPAPAWNDARALARGELGPAAASDQPFAAGQRRYSTSKLANVYLVLRRRAGGRVVGGQRGADLPRVSLSRTRSAPPSPAAGRLRAGACGRRRPRSGTARRG